MLETFAVLLIRNSGQRRFQHDGAPQNQVTAQKRGERSDG
jgi:hypothetical protein